MSHAGPNAAASARPSTGDQGAAPEGSKTWRDVVGAYVHEHLADSTLVRLSASGHCPNLSAPDETTDAIESYLRDVAGRHR